MIDNHFVQFFYGTIMCNRSRITDIVQYHEFLIVLTKKGACQVYDTFSYRRHMFLNPTKFDYVQTVFVNRLNDELIIVTFRQLDNNNILQCRSITYRYKHDEITIREIQERNISKSHLLFGSDVFIAPSYFEFDEYNEIIITYCASTQYGQESAF